MNYKEYNIRVIISRFLKYLYICKKDASSIYEITNNFKNNLVLL
jgi:hypothetical protein